MVAICTRIYRRRDFGSLDPNATRQTTTEASEVRGGGTANTTGANGTAMEVVVASATPWRKVNAGGT